MYLTDFITANDNWQELLATDPYNLSITSDGIYTIFKYNQLKSDFSIPLVRECRGIILRNSDYTVVCHPFDKFGNYGESYCPEIDWDTASVQTKIDGSLIKIWYDDIWHISTNGTIDAFDATLNNANFKTYGALMLHAIHRYFPNEHDFFELLDSAYTYMFELISPYNRVVIPYSEVDMYLLGMRHKDGYEVDPTTTVYAQYFKIPTRYPLTSLEEVQEVVNKMEWNEEGFVVCDKDFNRVKIKSPAYVIAHYARQNGQITDADLINVILSGEVKEFLIYADEYTSRLLHLKVMMDDLALYAIRSMANIIGENGYYFDHTTRRAYAQQVNALPAEIRDFLFHVYDTRIFYDYTKAQGWDGKKWAKALHL